MVQCTQPAEGARPPLLPLPLPPPMGTHLPWNCAGCGGGAEVTDPAGLVAGDGRRRVGRRGRGRRCAEAVQHGLAADAHREAAKARGSQPGRSAVDRGRWLDCGGCRAAESSRRLWPGGVRFGPWRDQGAQPMVHRAAGRESQRRRLRPFLLPFVARLSFAFAASLSSLQLLSVLCLSLRFRGCHVGCPFAAAEPTEPSRPHRASGIRLEPGPARRTSSSTRSLPAARSRCRRRQGRTPRPVAGASTAGGGRAAADLSSSGRRWARMWRMWRFAGRLRRRARCRARQRKRTGARAMSRPADGVGAG